MSRIPSTAANLIGNIFHDMAIRWEKIQKSSAVDPDPLVRGTDPAPDPSIIKQNSKKNLDSYCFMTSL
jgi:hypothetical protein